MRKGSSFGTSVRTVKGNYFKEKKGGPTSYWTHSFLWLEDSRFSGYLVDGSNRYPVIINKRGTRVEMNITKNNKLHELDFYIDNLRPDIGNPFKSKPK